MTDDYVVQMTMSGETTEPDLFAEIPTEVMRKVIQVIDALSGLDAVSDSYGHVVDVEWVVITYFDCTYGYVGRSEITGEFTFFRTKVSQDMRPTAGA